MKHYSSFSSCSDNPSSQVPLTNLRHSDTARYETPPPTHSRDCPDQRMRACWNRKCNVQSVLQLATRALKLSRQPLIQELWHPPFGSEWPCGRQVRHAYVLRGGPSGWLWDHDRVKRGKACVLACSNRKCDVRRWSWLVDGATMLVLGCLLWVARWRLVCG